VKYILLARDYTGPGTEHYFMGSGMWSSEVADAHHFASKSDAAEALSYSAFRTIAQIIEVPDAQEE
jgi:hypothetical protein